MAVSKRVLGALALVIIIIAVTVVGYWYYYIPKAEEGEAFKIAFIAEYEMEDAWPLWAYYDLMKIDEEYDDIEVTTTDMVSVADFERVAGDFAEDGYELVIGHTYDFMTAALSVAEKYPNTYFAIFGAWEFRDNLAGYACMENEGYYLAGMLAAHMSQTGKVGFVGAFKFPSQCIEFNGFKYGVKATNPNVTVLDAWTGEWMDVAKGYEVGSALTESGADIVAIGLGGAGYGVLDAAKDAGVYAIGTMIDMYDYAPNTIMTSVIWRSYAAFLAMIEDIKEGTFEGKVYEFGLEVSGGGSDLSPYHEFEDDISQTVKDEIDEARDGIRKGTVLVPYLPYYE